MSHNGTHPSVVVTGATGFLGSHFLLALHERRRSQVWSLVRGASEQAARAKLSEALRTSAEAYRAYRDHVTVSAAVRVVLGDISAPGCGVESSALDSLANADIDEFWHFAGSLNFEEKQREFVWTHNVHGARNAFDLALRVGARRFIYVSTAYTAGKLTGVIPEALHDPSGPFNNCYEESKCHTEHLLTRLCAEAGIPLTILRPSIVVGPSESKLPGGSRSGLYGFVREMNRLATAIKNWSGPVRLAADPEIPLNLIPVDHMVEDILHVIAQRFALPPILHLTSSRSPSVATCLMTVTQGLGLRNIELYQGAKDSYSPLERLIDQRVVFYGGYFSGAKESARALPGRWEVSDQDYRGLATEGIRDRRRTSVTSVFTRGEVKSFDQSLLSTYACGDPSKVPVVLSNAVGMPAAFWTPLAARLSNQNHVLTWETRGVPSFDPDFAQKECDVDAHVRDLLAVLTENGIQQAHLIGWCTGALVALKAAYLAPERVRSLVLLNGSFSLSAAHPRTPFERNMRLVMPRIASSRRTAELYYRTIYLPTRNGGGSEPTDQAEVQIAQLLMSTDPDLIHLTSYPYDSVDTLHRYGRLITETLKEDLEGWIDGVRCPALVVSGERDATEHPAASRHVASRLDDALLEVYPEMDHFGLFNSPELAEAVAAFLHAQDSREMPSLALELGLQE